MTFKYTAGPEKRHVGRYRLRCEDACKREPKRLGINPETWEAGDFELIIPEAGCTQRQFHVRSDIYPNFQKWKGKKKKKMKGQIWQTGQQQTSVRREMKTTIHEQAYQYKTDTTPEGSSWVRLRLFTVSLQGVGSHGFKKFPVFCSFL